jgi:hypothetical protein
MAVILVRGISTNRPSGSGKNLGDFILGTLKKASAAAFQGTGSDPL